MNPDDFPDISALGGDPLANPNVVAGYLRQPSEAGQFSTPPEFGQMPGLSAQEQPQLALDPEQKAMALGGLHKQFGGPAGAHKALNDLLASSPDLQPQFGQPGSINAKSLDDILTKMGPFEALSLMNRFRDTQSARK